ncbi:MULTISPECIES: DUF4136 domain-containing protein [Gammaproteobacteria]|jgi:hypothetical protein|uniref:Uncharacterized protein DUF4136 n=2 Tax=Stenotrophomonas TaxID=40323 RepID=A0A498CQB5_9GAMM|nr:MULTISPECIES: DUF4136 domain-containing protein [Stenotrophomonas]MBU2050409.1 DUF4136 domain-containing protein [Gammaproteobacteria bacterium]OFS96527.1 hypothetical protein HMPREF3113_03205 [Stenotrophomonas sp. HMSC10F06]RLK56095.1 uncharacterized protein DUF4136 [Stenotrophomonas rhizophila]HAU80292.1 DUF4136 domain-containing protein [Stenotrophomonas sp.]
MKAFAIAVLATSLVACASTPTVKTDFDPSASFASYKTYTWAMKPQASSPLVQQRIIDGINARLQAKGLREAPNGDIALAAHIATGQKQTLDTFYSGTGMGGWGWRGGGWGGGMAMGNATTTVHTYDVGTLVVDMFDAKTKQAVWRGTASGTVPTSPDKVNAAVEAGLDKLFAAFPPGTTAAR